MNDDATDDRRVLLRRALVKAGREERVSSELRSRLVATAALSAITKTTASSAAEIAKSGGGAVPPAGASTTTMSVAGTAAAWKTVGILFAIGAVAVSTMTYTRRTTETRSLPPLPTSAELGPAPPSVSAPPPEAPAEVATLTVDQLHNAPSATPARKADDGKRGTKLAAPAVDEPSTPRPSNAAGLGEEMRRVAEIRAAANGGQPGEALRLLEEYRTDFPSGMLAEETEVLKIESLSRLGRTSAAAALARKFLKDRPNSPYVGRIRATLSTLPTSDD